MKRGGRVAFEKIRRATYDKDGWSLLVYIDLVLIWCLVGLACYESLIAILLVTKIVMVLACSALAC